MSNIILCADDSKTMQTVAEITFRVSDYEYVGAASADDALVKARDLKPALILADAAMPGKDGYDLCREVKSDPALAGVPVIMLCGNSSGYDAARGTEVGADGHLNKPWDTQFMLDKVAEILEKAGAGAKGQAAAGAKAPGKAAVVPKPPILPSQAPAQAPAQAQQTGKPAQTGKPSRAGVRNATMLGMPQAAPGEAADRPAAKVPGRPARPATGRPAPAPQSGDTGQALGAPLPPVRKAPAAAPPTRAPSAAPARPQPQAASPTPEQAGGSPRLYPSAPPRGQTKTPAAPPGAPGRQRAATPAPSAPTPISRPPMIKGTPKRRPSVAAGAGQAAQAAQLSAQVQAAVPRAAAAAAQEAGLDPSGPEMRALIALSKDVVERVVWEVVPDLAETIIRENLEQLAAKR